jgi:hypothetical protein
MHNLSHVFTHVFAHTQLVKHVRLSKQSGKPIAFLAKKHASGNTLVGSEKDAEIWLRKSAEAGHLDAQVPANIYERNLGA